MDQSEILWFLIIILTFLLESMLIVGFHSTKNFFLLFCGVLF